MLLSSFIAASLCVMLFSCSWTHWRAFLQFPKPSSTNVELWHLLKFSMFIVIILYNNLIKVILVSLSCFSSLNYLSFLLLPSFPFFNSFLESFVYFSCFWVSLPFYHEDLAMQKFCSSIILSPSFFNLCRLLSLIPPTFIKYNSQAYYYIDKDRSSEGLSEIPSVRSVQYN